MDGRFLNLTKHPVQVRCTGHSGLRLLSLQKVEKDGLWWFRPTIASFTFFFFFGAKVRLRPKAFLRLKSSEQDGPQSHPLLRQTRRQALGVDAFFLRSPSRELRIEHMSFCTMVLTLE